MKDFSKNKAVYYAGAIVLLIIILFEAQGEGDFNIFISASKDLAHGKNIYATLYNEWFHYYYSVLFALALNPFTFLPLYFTKVLWLLVNVFFVYRIWKIMTYWLPLQDLSVRSKNLFTALAFVFILRFLRDNFHLAQMTVFILYLSLEGIYLIEKNKKLSGSCLIALGIDIKLMPLILIPYLIYRGEWKALVFTIGFLVAFLVLPALFIGMDYNSFLLSERWHLINPTNAEHVFDTAERSFHSLTTLLTTLLVQDCGDYHALPLRRNIANVSVETLNLVITLVRAVFVLLTLYFLRSKPFTAARSNLHKLYELSYIFLITPLIFPHQQHYAFLFIFPASTYLVFYFVYRFVNLRAGKSDKHVRTKKMIFCVVGLLIYFLTSSHFILGQFNVYYDHFKTLTYGVLLLLLLLAICRPDPIVKQQELTQ